MSSIVQGNNFLFRRLLQLGGVSYADLATADEVKVKLSGRGEVTDTLEMTLSGNPTQVTIDDPSTGYVSWQLVAADTSALSLGFYNLCIQIEYGGSVNVYEFIDSDPVKITDQYIT